MFAACLLLCSLIGELKQKILSSELQVMHSLAGGLSVQEAEEVELLEEHGRCLL